MTDPDRSPWRSVRQVALFLAALYLFFISIDLMSAAFRMAGTDFARQLITTASDPIAGLLIGFLTTSLVQSSSCTTSIVVGLVAAGALPLRLAVPIVMGANIGTTITATIVSFGHVTHPREFEKAFSAATVHDFFNILAVAVLLPIEVLFHPVEHLAVFFEGIFSGIGGLQLASPLKAVVTPVTELVTGIIPWVIPLLIIAITALFFALSRMVRIMRTAVLTRVEVLFDRVLFRNDTASFTLGMTLTALVQSSSATTSLVVPLVGTGVLTLRKIFPYTLGANVGTTITAILASLATGNRIAVEVALAHLSFNALGIAIFYPLRALPIWIATQAGRFASRTRRNTIFLVMGYVALDILIILYLFLR